LVQDQPYDFFEVAEAQASRDYLSRLEGERFFADLRRQEALRQAELQREEALAAQYRRRLSRSFIPGGYPAYLPPRALRRQVPRPQGVSPVILPSVGEERSVEEYLGRALAALLGLEGDDFEAECLNAEKVIIFLTHTSSSACSIKNLLSRLALKKQTVSPFLQRSDVSSLSKKLVNAPHSNRLARPRDLNKLTKLLHSNRLTRPLYSNKFARPLHSNKLAKYLLFKSQQELPLSRTLSEPLTSKKPRMISLSWSRIDSLSLGMLSRRLRLRRLRK